MKDPDWATRSLLCSETQRQCSSGEVKTVPGKLHPLAPERVLSAGRAGALVGGLVQAPAGGSTQHGEGGTPAHEYLTDTVATEEGHEPPLVRLRFPRNARIYGIPALSDPSAARLPAALLARLDFSRLQAA